MGEKTRRFSLVDLLLWFVLNISNLSVNGYTFVAPPPCAPRSPFPCSLPFPWRIELLPLSIPSLSYVSSFPSPWRRELLPLPIPSLADVSSFPSPWQRKLLPLSMSALSPLPWRASPALDLAVLSAGTNLCPSSAVGGRGSGTIDAPGELGGRPAIRPTVRLPPCRR